MMIMIILSPILLLSIIATATANDAATVMDVDAEGNIIEIDIDSSLNEALKLNSFGDPFASVSIHIHRNGEAASCEDIDAPDYDDDEEEVEESPFLSAIRKELNEFEVKNNQILQNKYGFDSLLTRSLANWLVHEDRCYEFGYDEDNEIDYSALIDYCDMGEDRTTIQKDHHLLMGVPLMEQGEASFALPCHYYTREGLRITSLMQLADIARSISEDDDDDELHLYAVPAGRLFSFAASYLGEVFELNHLKLSKHEDQPLSLKVISLIPRVFEITNFFDNKEADELIRIALGEESEENRLQRLKSGQDEHSFLHTRTSESAFVSDKFQTVMDLKLRGFELLGLDEYDQCKGDGLQVIRYNESTADMSHVDYIGFHTPDEDMEPSPYDTERGGVNRFATITLYLSDVEEESGGATVFPRGASFSESKLPRVRSSEEALEFLRDEGMTGNLPEGSWEEDMLIDCHTKFTVRPQKGRAILFYSQQPDGKLDRESESGSCPLIHGQKWTANLWLWNGPRELCPDGPQQQVLNAYGPPLQALFVNKGEDPEMEHAQLFFEDSFWSPIGHDDSPQMIDTYPGHEWNIRVDGEIVKKWTIEDGDKVQSFYL